MARAAPIAAVSASFVALVSFAGCGAGEAGSAGGSGRAHSQARESTPEALPPELAQILHQGPGGPAMDDAVDLYGDGSAVRIVLDPASR